MRIAGWPRQLNEYLLESQERYQRDGFSWGGFDCVVFVADWVNRCQGRDADILAPYRNAYATQEEGWALLQQHDGDLHQALLSRLGEPKHPSKAQRGDVLYSEELRACGLCIMHGAWMRGLFLGEGGFAMHRVRDCTHAFSV